MKLSKLKLWNYRSFGSEEQVILIDQLKYVLLATGPRMMGTLHFLLQTMNNWRLLLYRRIYY